MNQHSTRTTAAQRQREIEALALGGYGITPDQLSPAVLFCLGQLQCAQMVAISEGVGSGELPERLRARVQEREAELRRLLDEQDHQHAGQDDEADAKPRLPVEALSATDQLYDAHVLLAYLWRSLDRAPSEGLDLDADEAAGLIAALDTARWLVCDSRKAILGERPAGGAV